MEKIAFSLAGYRLPGGRRRGGRKIRPDFARLKTTTYYSGKER
jgi:hypothetical protein